MMSTLEFPDRPTASQASGTEAGHAAPRATASDGRIVAAEDDDGDRSEGAGLPAEQPPTTIAATAKAAVAGWVRRRFRVFMAVCLADPARAARVV
jgi:hypothetical protein